MIAIPGNNTLKITYMEITNSNCFGYWDVEDQYEMCDDEKKLIRMTDEEAEEYAAEVEYDRNINDDIF